MDVTVWSDADEFFIGDWNNHKIRLVRDGEVETIIGTQSLAMVIQTFKNASHPGFTGPKSRSITRLPPN